MFADFSQLLFEPAQAFVQQMDQLADLDALLTRWNFLKRVTSGTPGLPKRQLTPGSSRVGTPSLPKLSKKSSDRTISTQCLSQRPPRPAFRPEYKPAARRPWKEVAEAAAAANRKGATSSAKNTVKFIRGKLPTAKVAAQETQSINFLHHFFKNKSFSKTDAESTGTKVGSGQKRFYFAEDRRAGKSVPSLGPSGPFQMAVVPEDEYELSSYDEGEGNFGGSKKLLASVQPPLAPQSPERVRKQAPGKKSRPEGRENTDQGNRDSRWTPSSGSTDSLGYFLPPSNRTIEINGKKIPDWAQDLEAVRVQNLADKAQNRHLEVFGWIDTKQRVPLAQIFGTSSIFLELPSEGEDWSDDDCVLPDPPKRPH